MVTSSVATHMSAMCPPNIGTSSGEKSSCRTSTCHRKIPYDQRPSASIGGEDSTRKRAPGAASTSGESRHHAMSAPENVRPANSAGVAWTKPSV